jgi:hypothetical protein
MSYTDIELNALKKVKEKYNESARNWNQDKKEWDQIWEKLPPILKTFVLTCPTLGDYGPVVAKAMLIRMHIVKTANDLLFCLEIGKPFGLSVTWPDGKEPKTDDELLALKEMPLVE